VHRRSARHGSGTWLPLDKPAVEEEVPQISDSRSGNYQYDWILNLVGVPIFFNWILCIISSLLAYYGYGWILSALRRLIYVHICTESLQRVFTGILASIATHRAGELLGLARVTGTQEL
jgi:hypothetical protein